MISSTESREVRAEQRPMCQRPFLAGDPARHESWLWSEGGCDHRATWRVIAYVQRSMGDRYRDRILVRDVVIVYGCGSHPLPTGARAPWTGPVEGITAEPLEGYELPRALRPLRARTSRRAA